MPFLFYRLIHPYNETCMFNTVYILPFSYIVVLLFVHVLVRNDEIKMFNQNKNLYELHDDFRQLYIKLSTNSLKIYQYTPSDINSDNFYGKNVISLRQ